jgi:hypothetical protein
LSISKNADLSTNCNLLVWQSAPFKALLKKSPMSWTCQNSPVQYIDIRILRAREKNFPQKSKLFVSSAE